MQLPAKWGWSLASGLASLGFVAAIYAIESRGGVFPVPLVLLYALVASLAGLGGVAAGAVAGVIAAGFVAVAHVTGLGPAEHTGSLLNSALAGTIFLGTGGGVGLLREAFDQKAARLSELLREKSRRLDESETRFAHAVTAVSDGVWDWNIATGELYFSRRWCEMLGYRQEELAPRLETATQLVAPEDERRVAALIVETSTGQRDSFETQVRLRHKSGEWITVLSRGLVVRRDGAPARVIGTSVDITERLRVMEMLERTEEMLHEGIRALPIGFAFFDGDDALVLFNDAYTRHLQVGGRLLRKGMKFEELIEAGAGEVAGRLGYESATAYLEARVAATRRGRAPWLYEMADGSWIRMTEYPTHSGGFISLIEDVTEERRSEMHVRQAQRLEVIGQLTGGIAHDFNNLLAVIQSAAELMKIGAGNEAELVEQTLRAVRRGSDLTRRLLAYASRQPLAPAAVDCAKLVEGIREVLERVLDKRIALAVEIEPGLWRAHADPGQLEDALMNLALNARDAMPGAGRLTIRCANLTLEPGAVAQPPEAAPGDYVRFTVSDTGTGMTPEVLDRAIEPFFTTKEFGKGSGLGLSMVYGFVRQSGGLFSIESEPGRGTTVTIDLPREAQPPARAAGTPLDEVPAGSGEAVLVIEDDPAVRELVTRTLADLAYRPTAVGDAAAAQALIRDGRGFDLVLTDVVLPGGISGPEFARRLDGALPPERVIFMSGYPEDEALAGLDETRNPLLHKPFTRETLAAALGRALAARPEADLT